MPLTRQVRSKASEETIDGGVAALAPHHITKGDEAGLFPAAAPAPASIHVSADGTAAHSSSASMSAAPSADHPVASAAAAALPAVGGRAFRAFHASAEVSTTNVKPVASSTVMLRITIPHQHAASAAQMPQLGSPDAASSVGRTRAQSADARAHLERVREAAQAAGQQPAAQGGQQGSLEGTHVSQSGKAAAEAGSSQAAEQVPPKGPTMQTRSRGILRKLKLRADGTHDSGAPQLQPSSPRSPTQARSPPAVRSPPLQPRGEPSSPRAVTRSSQRRCVAQPASGKPPGVLQDC